MLVTSTYTGKVSVIDHSQGCVKKTPFCHARTFPPRKKYPLVKVQIYHSISSICICSFISLYTPPNTKDTLYLPSHSVPFPSLLLLYTHHRHTSMFTQTCPPFPPLPSSFLPVPLSHDIHFCPSLDTSRNTFHLAPVPTTAHQNLVEIHQRGTHSTRACRNSPHLAPIRTSRQRSPPLGARSPGRHITRASFQSPMTV